MDEFDLKIQFSLEADEWIMISVHFDSLPLRFGGGLEDRAGLHF